MLNVPVVIYYVECCSESCGIAVPDTGLLVITGGRASGYSGIVDVKEYSAQGSGLPLPDLNQPRYDHGCAYYYDNSHQVVSHQAIMEALKKSFKVLKYEKF